MVKASAEAAGEFHVSRGGAQLSRMDISLPCGAGTMLARLSVTDVGWWVGGLEMSGWEPRHREAERIRQRRKEGTRDARRLPPVL